MFESLAVASRQLQRPRRRNNLLHHAAHEDILNQENRIEEKNFRDRRIKVTAATEPEREPSEFLTLCPFLVSSFPDSKILSSFPASTFGLRHFQHILDIRSLPSLAGHPWFREQKHAHTWNLT